MSSIKSVTRHLFVALCNRHGGFVSVADLTTWGLKTSDERFLFLPTVGAAAFQFNNGHVDQTAAAINQLLEADKYPERVTQWWMDHNSLLGAIPLVLVATKKTEILKEKLNLAV